MEKKAYITASELAELLGISVSRAYRIIHDMNKELANKGYLTVAGRVPTKYFEERWYSGKELKCI
ncbi:ICEBs1 excisionase [[Clostridium] innocuum]|uniref:ICEBs1 excisionase n=1 Tax=Clostridium innocuum TaxID=1522 RepID=UPI003256CC9B